MAADETPTHKLVIDESCGSQNSSPTFSGLDLFDELLLQDLDNKKDRELQELKHQVSTLSREKRTLAQKLTDLEAELTQVATQFRKLFFAAKQSDHLARQKLQAAESRQNQPVTLKCPSCQEVSIVNRKTPPKRRDVKVYRPKKSVEIWFSSLPELEFFVRSHGLEESKDGLPTLEKDLHRFVDYISDNPSLDSFDNSPLIAYLKERKLKFFVEDRKTGSDNVSEKTLGTVELDDENNNLKRIRPDGGMRLVAERIVMDGREVAILRPDDESIGEGSEEPNDSLANESGQNSSRADRKSLDGRSEDVKMSGKSEIQQNKAAKNIKTSTVAAGNSASVSSQNDTNDADLVVKKLALNGEWRPLASKPDVRKGAKKSGISCPLDLLLPDKAASGKAKIQLAKATLVKSSNSSQTQNKSGSTPWTDSQESDWSNRTPGFPSSDPLGLEKSESDPENQAALPWGLKEPDANRHFGRAPAEERYGHLVTSGRVKMKTKPRDPRLRNNGELASEKSLEGTKTASKSMKTGRSSEEKAEKSTIHEVTSEKPASAKTKGTRPDNAKVGNRDTQKGVMVEKSLECAETVSLLSKSAEKITEESKDETVTGKSKRLAKSESEKPASSQANRVLPVNEKAEKSREKPKTTLDMPDAASVVAKMPRIPKLPPKPVERVSDVFIEPNLSNRSKRKRDKEPVSKDEDLRRRARSRSASVARSISDKYSQMRRKQEGGSQVQTSANSTTRYRDNESGKCERKSYMYFDRKEKSRRSGDRTGQNRHNNRLSDRSKERRMDSFRRNSSNRRENRSLDSLHHSPNRGRSRKSRDVDPSHRQRQRSRNASQCDGARRSRTSRSYEKEQNWSQDFDQQSKSGEKKRGSSNRYDQFENRECETSPVTRLRRLSGCEAPIFAQSTGGEIERSENERSEARKTTPSSPSPTSMDDSDLEEGEVKSPEKSKFGDSKKQESSRVVSSWIDAVKLKRSKKLSGTPETGADVDQAEKQEETIEEDNSKQKTTVETPNSKPVSTAKNRTPRRLKTKICPSSVGDSPVTVWIADDNAREPLTTVTSPKTGFLGSKILPQPESAVKLPQNDLKTSKTGKMNVACESVVESGRTLGPAHNLKHEREKLTEKLAEESVLSPGDALAASPKSGRTGVEKIADEALSDEENTLKFAKIDAVIQETRISVEKGDFSEENISTSIHTVCERVKELRTSMQPISKSEMETGKSRGSAKSSKAGKASRESVKRKKAQKLASDEGAEESQDGAVLKRSRKTKKVQKQVVDTNPNTSTTEAENLGVNRGLELGNVDPPPKDFSEKKLTERSESCSVSETNSEKIANENVPQEQRAESQAAAESKIEKVHENESTEKGSEVEASRKSEVIEPEPLANLEDATLNDRPGSGVLNDGPSVIKEGRRTTEKELGNQVLNPGETDVESDVKVNGTAELTANPEKDPSLSQPRKLQTPNKSIAASPEKSDPESPKATRSNPLEIETSLKSPVGFCETSPTCSSVSPGLSETEVSPKNWRAHASVTPSPVRIGSQDSNSMSGLVTPGKNLFLRADSGGISANSSISKEVKTEQIRNRIGSIMASRKRDLDEEGTPSCQHVDEGTPRNLKTAPPVRLRKSASVWGKIPEDLDVQILCEVRGQKSAEGTPISGGFKVTEDTVPKVKGQNMTSTGGQTTTGSILESDLYLSSPDSGVKRPNRDFSNEQASFAKKNLFGAHGTENPEGVSLQNAQKSSLEKSFGAENERKRPSTSDGDPLAKKTCFQLSSVERSVELDFESTNVLDFGSQFGCGDSSDSENEETEK